VRIKGTCKNCGREWLADQLVESGGHCPWCGQAFTRDYTANLARALEVAGTGGQVLEDALQQIADMDPNLELQDDSIVEPLRESLRSLRRRKARR
jgi:uncharacterized protein (DUF983 family)